MQYFSGCRSFAPTPQPATKPTSGPRGRAESRNKRQELPVGIRAVQRNSRKRKKKKKRKARDSHAASAAQDRRAPASARLLTRLLPREDGK